MIRKATAVKKKAKPIPPPKPRKRIDKAAIAAMLDEEPTPDIPGAYFGVYKGIQSRGALAYKRDDKHVWTIMCSETGGQRVIVKWTAGNFDANMRKCRAPINSHLKRYPVERAIDVYLAEGAVYEPEAYRILMRLKAGKDIDDVTMDDLLDTTPSFAIPQRKFRGTRTESQKLNRRLKRQQKLASMTPSELRAWRDKRNARRKLKRANAAKRRKA